MNIYIDTNVFIEKGLDKNQYQDFSILVENNLICIYTHDFVLKELRRNIYIDLKNIAIKNPCILSDAGIEMPNLGRTSAGRSRIV